MGTIAASALRRSGVAVAGTVIAVAVLSTAACGNTPDKAGQTTAPAVSTTEKAAIGAPSPGGAKNPNDGWEGRPGENGGRPDMTDMGSQPNSNAPAPMNPFPGQNVPTN